MRSPRRSTSRLLPIIGLLLALALSGCRLQSAPTSEPTSTATMPVVTTTPIAGAEREIVILHTNDEHGYLEHEEANGFASGGADLAAALWSQRGHDPLAADSNVLLLSGGDNWTGPAISTWFKGESAVEVMNAMGYRASVPGNHDFDFGQDELRARLDEAQFPYLAANVTTASGELYELFQPFTIVTVNGVRVGIIGLALEETPSVTAAKGIEGLSFGPYEPALREWVPQAREAGAQVIVVETHACNDALLRLAADVQDLNIALLQGGHCHTSMVNQIGTTLVSSGSSAWRDYVLTRLTVDADTGTVLAAEQQLLDVLAPTSVALPEPPAAVAEAVAKWSERATTMLGEVIGYTATGIGQHSAEMHNLLVDSWLWAYPNAQIAISNTGGFREQIPPGEITLETVIGVLPFDNELFEIEATGAQIVQALAQAPEGLVLGGAVLEGGELLLADGTVARDDEVYHVLITDYLYGNDKYPFAGYDPQPYETSIHWRQPVIDWITAQHSSRERPIERLLDGTVRLP